MADITAGGILAAVEALADAETFTRGQVAYLVHLAFESGRTASYRDGLAELHGAWARSRWRRRYAELVADRVGAYGAAAARMNTRLGRPAGYRYDGGPVDWDTGQPLDVPRQRSRRSAFQRTHRGAA